MKVEIDANVDYFASTQLSHKLIDKVLNSLENKDHYQWINEGVVSRTTLNYGWNFVELEKKQKVYVEMPKEIIEIRNHIYGCFKGHIYEGKSADDFDNAIVTFYKPGDCLIPHTDRDKSDVLEKGYYFGESMFGVVLEADSKGSLRFVHYPQKGKPPFNYPTSFYIDEKKGSAFLIQGKIRHYPYFHMIEKIENKRISITFRKVVFDNFF